jgi:hypothetical protein
MDTLRRSTRRDQFQSRIFFSQVAVTPLASDRSGCRLTSRTPRTLPRGARRGRDGCRSRSHQHARGTTLRPYKLAAGLSGPPPCVSLQILQHAQPAGSPQALSQNDVLLAARKKLASQQTPLPSSSGRGGGMGLEPVAASREDEEAKKMEAGGDTIGQKLDAGALFVLQSKGKLPRSAFLLPPSLLLHLHGKRVLLANPLQPSLCFLSAGKDHGEATGCYCSQTRNLGVAQPELVSSFLSSFSNELASSKRLNHAKTVTRQL